MTLISLLIVQDKNYSYLKIWNFNQLIVFLSSFNLILPTITMYSLSLSDFGRHLDRVIHIKVITQLLQLFVVNIPFFGVRIYLWWVFFLSEKSWKKKSWVFFFSFFFWKVKFMSKNSILTKPQHFHEFLPNIFWQFFSWNQSCQQLKSPKPQHFHEFFTPKPSTIFSENQSWIFGQKMKISNSVFREHLESILYCICMYQDMFYL